MLPAQNLCALPDGWRMAGCVAFLTTEPFVLKKPVPCKGALGFWRVLQPVLDELGKEES